MVPLYSKGTEQNDAWCLEECLCESFWSWRCLCPWGETLMSSTEQWNVSCFFYFCKKKKKKIHWLASESLSCFMCETPLHQHGHCAKSPEVKSVCNCVQTRRRKCAYSLSNPQLGLKTTVENKCWHCTFRQTTRYTFILCSDNTVL